MATSKHWPRPRRKGLSPPEEQLISTSEHPGHTCNSWPHVYSYSLTLSQPPSLIHLFLRIAETLPQEVLTKMHAPPKSDYPVITTEILKEYDGFLFGIPTRYGNFPAQWKAFIDQTGGLWQSGALHGKYAGVFISTASIGGGQESTAISALSTFAHHGIIYVPLGYAKAFGPMSEVNEPRGGSAWGAGTLAGGDGSRQPSQKELGLAEVQGKSFYETLARAFP